MFYSRDVWSSVSRPTFRGQNVRKACRLIAFNRHFPPRSLVLGSYEPAIGIRDVGTQLLRLPLTDNV